MESKSLTDYLLFRTWWFYNARNPSWIETTLHAFNLFEGAVWLILAGLVIRRFLKHRQSGIELLYAAAFFTFGLTDFREAFALQSWLIWVKAVNLLVLIWLRSLVIKRFYPQSRLY